MKTTIEQAVMELKQVHHAEKHGLEYPKLKHIVSDDSMHQYDENGKLIQIIGSLGFTDVGGKEVAVCLFLDLRDYVD